MKTVGLLLILCVGPACGPKDVIPGAPNHPPSPTAPMKYMSETAATKTSFGSRSQTR